MKDFKDDDLSQKQKNKYKIIRLILQVLIILLLVGGLIALTIVLYPYINKINTDETYKNQVVEQINSFGYFSWAIIIGAQILQTVLAVIPSGPIVMVAGMMYHPAISVILCLIGQTVGGLIVYGLVKLLGYRFIALFFNPDKIKESKILQNGTRSEVLMFGYLLIPALPKDIVAFIAPFTKTKWYRFAIISFFARIPMTIVTVMMGASLIDQNYWVILVLGGLSALLAILCFIFNKRIVNFLDKKKIEEKPNLDE